MYKENINVHLCIYIKLFNMDILNFITWSADPELFSVGPLHIRWDSLMVISGFGRGYQIEDKM